MAPKRGKGRRKIGAARPLSDAPCRPVHVGISAVREGFLDETIAVWQPLAGRNLNREDAREIIHNVSGFFAVLMEWEKAERRAAQGAPDCDGAPVEPRTRRSSRSGGDNPRL